MNSKKEVQHVYLVGAKSLGAYGGYETFVYKLTEYHQNKENIKYHVACKANGDGCIERRFRDSDMSFMGSLFGLFSGCYDNLEFNIHLWFLPCFFVTVILFNILVNLGGRRMAYGLNINNNAGSTHIEGLQKFVVEKGLDVGFAYDGDADRCLCVDEKGNVITGDHILYIYGCYMKERGKLLNNTVVTTVMSNFGLYKAFDEQGIGYAKTAVGDKYVYEYMAKNRECSFFRDCCCLRCTSRSVPRMLLRTWKSKQKPFGWSRSNYMNRMRTVYCCGMRT